MPPILDGTADTGRWQQSRTLLSFPVRVTVLLAILVGELVVAMGGVW
jgi:hypothetical protein